MAIIKYIEFRGSCQGTLIGRGTDYEGYVRDDQRGAEAALALLNEWCGGAERKILATNFGPEELRTGRESAAVFFIRVLYEE